MTRTRLQTIVLLSLLAAHCSRTRPAPREHAWYSAPPQLLLNKVEPALVHPVPAAQIARATALLAQTPCVPLSQAEAESMAGGPVASPAGTTPYLVRGVERFPASAFTVTTSSGALHVHSFAMGHTTPPTQPHPIVVVLEERPKTIYLTSSVVE